MLFQVIFINNKNKQVQFLNTVIKYSTHPTWGIRYWMQWLHSWIAGVPPVLAFCSPAPWSRLCRRNVAAAATSSSAQLQLSPGTGSGTATSQGNIPSLHSVTSHQHLQGMLHLAVALLSPCYMCWVEAPSKSFLTCLPSLQLSFRF